MGILLVIIGILAILVLGIWWSRRIVQKQKEAAHQGFRYAGPVAPEPVANRRGGCGLFDCPNPRPHSHVMDLSKRLRGR